MPAPKETSALSCMKTQTGVEQRAHQKEAEQQQDSTDTEATDLMHQHQLTEIEADQTYEENAADLAPEKIKGIGGTEQEAVREQEDIITALMINITTTRTQPTHTTNQVMRNLH